MASGTTGTVVISILDGGSAVVVPASSIQAVIGTSSTGTANQPLAYKNINSLVAAYGYGPGVEAAALSIAAGGTVIFVKAATTTPGAQTAVTATAAGTSVVTVTGAAFDSYLVVVQYGVGGTISTTGITFRISLDGGKNFGPYLALGTATTYAIPQTGLTLNFAAGTVLSGGILRFSTTEPLWAISGVQSALSALQTSPFATSGWSSMHIVGAMSGANASTVQGYLNTMQTGYIYTRALVNARDALVPVAFGGAGETEATWLSAILTDYSAVSATRIDAHGGHYNMPSAIVNPAASTPRYRRPLSFASAARQVTIPPQRHSGRVRDGALAQIVIDPTTDPTDGFIYHDERNNPSLDAARFTSALTRVGLTGYYIANPQLMSPLGSVFVYLYYGQVMDVASTIANQIGQRDINADIRLNDNGTIYENEARAIESNMTNALRDQMISTQMLSNVIVAVDRAVNVRTTSNVNVAITLYARGYVLQESIQIAYGATS